MVIARQHCTDSTLMDVLGLLSRLWVSLLAVPCRRDPLPDVGLVFPLVLCLTCCLSTTFIHFIYYKASRYFTWM